jgi:uncharacterized protein YbcC (UPF0753/DUF2309 family)
MHAHHTDLTDKKSVILHYLDHLGHILPGQATIREFVHHNSIHGFQHLPFEDAVKEVESLTGVHGYLSDERNRALYQKGSINDEDLTAAIAHHKELKAEEYIIKTDRLSVSRNDIYRVALLYDLHSISASNLNWQIEEFDVLSKIQPDIPGSIRETLLATAQSEGHYAASLWSHILDQMEIDKIPLHPENMVDLSEEQANAWLDRIRAELPDSTNLMVHQKMRMEAQEKLDEMLDQIGVRLTMRDFVKTLTGVDILFSVRVQLIRICASALDEGVSAWRLPDYIKHGRTWLIMMRILFCMICRIGSVLSQKHPTIR